MGRGSRITTPPVLFFVLVGDSAWCLTLYSEMGVSTGLASGELLGNMLETYPDDMERALTRWEEKLRPFIVAQ